MTTSLLNLVSPTDPDYDAARAPWNLSADQRPALVLEAASAADVVDAARIARERGLKIAPQGTGHRATALPGLSDALLLRTARMNAVTVDPQARIARISAGALWRDVIAAAAPFGLAAPHGFAAGVGVTGYLLGGGLGWLARSHGFGSSHVRAFEVVTATGEPLRVDATHEPALFWALRGGGSCGVIVTAIELELIELREVYAGTVLWPMAHAAELAQAFRVWTACVPETLTSSLRLMRFPPAILHGKALVQLTLAFQGDAAEGDALLAPMRAVAPPVLESVRTVPAAALGEIAGDPDGPLPARGTSLLLRTLTPATIDAFVTHADPALGVLELRHLGGALRAQPGAIGGVNAQALLYASGAPGTPDVQAALRALRTALTPWAHTRGTLPTFDDAGTCTAPAPVREIAATYDPDGTIVTA